MYCIAARAVQGFSAPFVLDERRYWLIRSEVAMFLIVLVHGTKRHYVNSFLMTGVVLHWSGDKGRVNAFHTPFAPDDARCRAGMRHDSERYSYLNKGGC